jgi:hypothetical protein
MHTFRRRYARVIAAICALVALLILGVSSATDNAPANSPRILPVTGSMTLGGTATTTTPPPSPEIASASPTVKAPHK